MSFGVYGLTVFSSKHQGLDRRLHVFQQRSDRHVRELELDLAGLDLGQIEHVVDQT